MSRPENPDLINEIQQIAVNEIAVKGTDGISYAGDERQFFRGAYCT